MTDKQYIYKAHIDVSDINHHRYEHIDFTLSLLPHEDTQHLLLKLIGYCLFPFTESIISTSDDLPLHPDVGICDLDDHFKLWLDVGFPELKRIEKACRKSDQVIILTIAKSQWLAENKAKLLLLNNLHLLKIEADFLKFLQRDMSRKLVWSVILDQNRLALTSHNAFFETVIGEYPWIEHHIV